MIYVTKALMEKVDADYDEWCKHEELDHPVYIGISDFRAVPEISSEDQKLFTGVENLTAWPFPITNGVRNQDSQTLLDTKQKSARIKYDLNNEPEGLF